MLAPQFLDTERAIQYPKKSQFHPVDKGCPMSRPAVVFLILACTFRTCLAEIFDDPKSLSSALESEGLATQGWQPSKTFSGEWLSMSTLIPFGSKGSNGMRNNIAYYVNGTHPERANDIRIKVNINNGKEHKKAFQRLESATRTLFEFISHPIPSELEESLKNRNPVVLNTAFGTVELINEIGSIDSFKVILTDARYLEEQRRLRESSKSEYELCKKAVANAVGYSSSHLKGDGEPVQESGYVSYMLEQFSFK